MGDALLYDDEWQPIKEAFPDNFRLDYALSREQLNKDGGKMYIQDKVAEYSDEIFERMDNGAHMYFCGLKGMMPGITQMLESVSAKKGLVWEEKLKEWKKAGQWRRGLLSVSRLPPRGQGRQGLHASVVRLDCAWHCVGEISCASAGAGVSFMRVRQHGRGEAHFAQPLEI